jgi:Rhodopirellula transposase DDE domain
LFSHITMNWRGRPLTSHEVVVNTIAATTRTGLRVAAELDTASYPTGVKVSDDQLARYRSSATAGTASGTTPFTPCHPNPPKTTTMSLNPSAQPESPLAP